MFSVMQKADQIIWGGVGGMEHRDYPLRLPLTQGEGGILRGLRESRRGIAKRFPLLCKEGSGEVVLGRRDAGTTPSDSPLHRGRVEYYADWGLGREKCGTGVGDQVFGVQADL